MSQPDSVPEQDRIWSEALEAASQQLARREADLRILQAENKSLMQQLADERRRAERLAALADRFGVR